MDRYSIHVKLGSYTYAQTLEQIQRNCVVILLRWIEGVFLSHSMRLGMHIEGCKKNFMLLQQPPFQYSSWAMIR